MEKGGFMRIFKLEFQKIMKNPMLWLLAVVFCLVNCLIIYNEAGNKDTSNELVIMHDIIKKTDDTNHSRQAKNRNERKQLSEAYQEYYKENIDLYDKLDMTKILKQKEEMVQYHPKGFMKKFVKDNYEHLQKRVEKIKSDKEYNDAFYPGQYYKIHSLLYSKLGKKLIVEMSLLMARIILVAGLMEKEMVMETWCFLMAILISVSGAIIRFMAQVHTNIPRSMLYTKANGLKDYSMAMAITKI